MSEKNSDLIAVSKTLNEAAARIHKLKAETDDPAVYGALNDELIQINHRIGAVGGLIFRARSQAISLAAKKVEDSRGELTEAIKKIDDINKFISTISKFLVLVDKVISVAKLV